MAATLKSELGSSAARRKRTRVQEEARVRNYALNVLNIQAHVAGLMPDRRVVPSFRSVHKQQLSFLHKFCSWHRGVQTKNTEPQQGEQGRAQALRMSVAMGNFLKYTHTVAIGPDVLV